MVYFETKFPIRYYETDQMAVVHHSNYIRYFECARNLMMAELGYPIEQCEAEGVTVPIVKITCNYKFPAKMGDVITAVAMIDDVPLAKLKIRQQVLNQDGVVCADGEAVIGFLNKATGRPTRCPDPLARIIEQHLNDR